MSNTHTNTFHSHQQRYPSEPVLKEMKDWTDVTMDTDVDFGSLRNIQANMIAEIEAELENLTTLGETNISYFLIFKNYLLFTLFFPSNKLLQYFFGRIQQNPELSW